MPPRPPSTRTCLRTCSRRSSATIPASDYTSLAQPALFAVSYALGKTLLQSGIRPAFGIGHSVGELAAACLAGVLSVDDAARLVAVRGRLMGSLPPGGAMIAVDLGVEQAEALIADEPGARSRPSTGHARWPSPVPPTRWRGPAPRFARRAAER